VSLKVSRVFSRNRRDPDTQYRLLYLFDIRREVIVKMNSKRKYQVDLKPTNGFVKIINLKTTSLLFTAKTGGLELFPDFILKLYNNLYLFFGKIKE